jgi:hypothetical protein
MKKAGLTDIICFNCKHFDLIRIGGCKAFPGEIPDFILKGLSGHMNRLRGQQGDYVYTPIEKPMAIWRRIDRASRPIRRTDKKLSPERWL